VPRWYAPSQERVEEGHDGGRQDGLLARAIGAGGDVAHGLVEQVLGGAHNHLLHAQLGHVVQLGVLGGVDEAELRQLALRGGGQ
jgi:hypothetical protein